MLLQFYVGQWSESHFRPSLHLRSLISGNFGALAIVTQPRAQWAQSKTPGMWQVSGIARKDCHLQLFQGYLKIASLHKKTTGMRPTFYCPGMISDHLDSMELREREDILKFLVEAIVEFVDCPLGQSKVCRHATYGWPEILELISVRGILDMAFWCFQDSWTNWSSVCWLFTMSCMYVYIYIYTETYLYTHSVV